MVSPTEKVRIKSLISTTRVVAVETAEKSGRSPSIMETSDDGDTDEDDEPATDEEEKDEGLSHDQVSRGLSRMYQQTLEVLGDELV